MPEPASAWRITGALAVLLVVLTGCSGGPAPESSAGPPTGQSVSPAGSATGTAASPSSAGSPDAGDVRVALEQVGEGFEAPVGVVSPPGDPRRFVLEQTGRVRSLSDPDAVYLDLTDRVRSGGERGLLGLAFHPDFAVNGRLFVHYSGPDGRTVLAEFTATPAAAGVDVSTERILLEESQPAANHNGGTVRFGPDGLLYLGLGDGGAAGDRFGNGQDPGTLLGAILRLDVDAGDPYGIPADNPFADGGGAPEVFLYGLRNPFRFTIDAGHLLIGDVGQDAVEELDVVPLDAGGANLGWPLLEGSACYAQDDCSPDGTLLPALEYTHGETGGCAVIAGEVYAGDALPGLRGQWFYSDLCAGFLRSVTVSDGVVVAEHDWTDQVGGPVGRVLSFGRDADGELYLTTADGRVWRLVGA